MTELRGMHHKGEQNNGPFNSDEFHTSDSVNDQGKVKGVSLILEDIMRDNIWK
jgi:hypothetical protein